MYHACPVLTWTDSYPLIHLYIYLLVVLLVLFCTKLSCHHDPEASVCVAFSVTRIIGNSLVCIAAYRNTKLQSSTNLYIIALAVSDLEHW